MQLFLVKAVIRAFCFLVASGIFYLAWNVCLIYGTEIPRLGFWNIVGTTFFTYHGVDLLHILYKMEDTELL